MIPHSKWFHMSLAIALVLMVTPPALGTVKIKSVSADQNLITVTDLDGSDWTYAVTDGAKIFLPDGKQGKLSDLKAGQEVSLLWEKRATKYYTSFILLQEGDLKDALLTEGTVKRVNADQNEIVLADSTNRDWTYRLADKIRVSVGTKTGKLGDLKEGDTIIIVYERKGERLDVREIWADRR